MKRVVILSGIALVVSTTWLVTNRVSRPPRMPIKVQSQNSSPEVADSDEEFRQRIRSIVKKVTADIKQEQATVKSDASKTVRPKALSSS